MCFSSLIKESPNVYLCYIFLYVLLMSNQNTKNMFVFFFTYFFTKEIWTENVKKWLIWAKSKFGQRWSNPSWSRVSQDFWLIISQKTPRFTCLFPCLLWQVKNRARTKKCQKAKFLPIFSGRNRFPIYWKPVSCTNFAKILQFSAFVNSDLIQKIFHYFKLINSTIHLLLITCEPLDYNFPS